MERINGFKAAVAAVLGCLTALWGWFGWLVLTWVGCMLLDYITGSAAALRAGKWSSAAARDGLWHKLGAIAAVLVSVILDGVIGLITGLFNGVYAMLPDFPRVVGSSANLGRVGLEEGRIQVCAFLRCARAEEAELLARRHDGAAEAAGFTLAHCAAYPGWPGRADNPLAALMDRVFRREAGRGLEISAVHVGLEPSVFGEKCPGLAMVSTGPDILDAHSVAERAPLAGLPGYALLLAGTWEALARGEGGL